MSRVRETDGESNGRWFEEPQREGMNRSSRNTITHSGGVLIVIVIVIVIGCRTPIDDDDDGEGDDGGQGRTGGGEQAVSKRITGGDEPLPYGRKRNPLRVPLPLPLPLPLPDAPRLKF